jgi:hypothetical protein
MLNLLLLHGNSGYANASVCYPYIYIAYVVTETECLLCGKSWFFIYIYIYIYNVGYMQPPKWRVASSLPFIELFKYGMAKLRTAEVNPLTGRFNM